MKTKFKFLIAIFFLFNPFYSSAQCFVEPSLIGTINGTTGFGISECSFTGSFPMTVQYAVANSIGNFTWGISPGNTITTLGVATWTSAATSVVGTDFISIIDLNNCTTFFSIQRCCPITGLHIFDSSIGQVVASGQFTAAQLYLNAGSWQFDGVTFTIDGYLDCSNNNVNFVNCIVKMGPGAVIYTNAGGWGTGIPNLLINNSTFEGTGQCPTHSDFPRMWRGFRHDNVAYFEIINHSNIYDAQYAILLNHGLVLRSFNTDWQRNYISIFAPHGNNGNSFWDIGAGMPSIIESNTFDGTVPLAEDFFGQAPATQDHKSLAGIYVNDLVTNLVTNRAIPTSTSVGTFNYFHNLNMGIVGEHSEMDIFNCHFDNIQPVPAYQSGFPFSGSAIHSVNANINPVTLTVGNFDVTDTRHNEFLNCYDGVTLVRNVNGSIINNTFSINNPTQNYYSGIGSWENISRTLNFSNNTFDVYQGGFFVIQPTGADLFINNNQFNHTLIPPPYLPNPGSAVGIAVAFYFPAALNLAGINGNNFQNGRNNIYIINAVGSANRINMIGNTMHFDLPFSQMTDQHYGIWLDNVTNAWAEDNTIDRNLPIQFAPTSFDKLLRGFNLKDVTRSDIHTNSCLNLGTDVRLVGNCIDTYFGCNSFSTSAPTSAVPYNKKSFFLDIAIMSDQAPPSNLNGNSWNNIDLAFGSVNRVEGMNNGSPINWYFDGAFAYDPNPFSVNPPFTFNPQITSGTPCDNHEPRDEGGLHNIVNNEVTFDEYAVQFDYSGESYAYDALKEDDSLRNSNSDFIAFYANHSTNNIGKYSGAKDDAQVQDWDNALAKINSLINPTQIEQYKQTAAQIALDVLRDHRKLTASEINILTPIAYMTSWEGGEAVFIARALLHIEVDDQEQHLRLGRPNSGEAKVGSLSIFPNPVNKTIYLHSSDALENSTAEIFDVFGRKISSVTVSVSSIDVSALSGGIYWLKLKSISGSLHNQSFVVVR